MFGDMYIVSVRGLVRGTLPGSPAGHASCSIVDRDNGVTFPSGMGHQLWFAPVFSDISCQVCMLACCLAFMFRHKT